jgi:hypothetical protein
VWELDQQYHPFRSPPTTTLSARSDAQALTWILG